MQDEKGQALICKNNDSFEWLKEYILPFDKRECAIKMHDSSEPAVFTFPYFKGEREFVSDSGSHHSGSPRWMTWWRETGEAYPVTLISAGARDVTAGRRSPTGQSTSKTGGVKAYMSVLVIIFT